MNQIQELEPEIREAMNLLNIEHLPNRYELSIIDKKYIESKISRNGGYILVGDALGIPTRGKGKIKYPRWTESNIIKELDKVKNALNISRMPTRSEIISITNDCSLTSAISHGIGYYGLADKLELEIKDSETTLGKKYEHIISDKLFSMGYIPTDMPQNFPYDILLNNSLKIDVKFSYLYKGKIGNFYSYNMEKPYCTCDIYILVSQVDEFSDDIKYRIVPSHHIYKNTQVSIGELTSKYDVYIDRWDYIDKYLDFYNSVVPMVIE